MPNAGPIAPAAAPSAPARKSSSKAVKGYRPPDARLGWYGAGIDRTRAVVELKSPGADLEAKQGVAYGRLTPVEQEFGYSAKVDDCCRPRS
ncbi:hypothetical protein [Halochromatium roseum]|uniref:hypothetical protein n=1 Tax=Halochromatium roseum TaxID=391920 RepID=UPI0019146411|nr:hypothetical protein [Halochromatium roseum]